MLSPGEPGADLFYTIGRRIRHARRQRGHTQADLGRAVGVSRTSINNIEAGRQRLPIDLLYDIADVLDIQAVSLLPPNEDV
jgi:transcriptional regulator with XRE-family HTH domain